jgi:hypothetical protein
MEGLEENEASQEAYYMAESKSEVGEADVEIEAHVCNFLMIDISCISFCLEAFQAEKVLFEFK